MHHFYFVLCQVLQDIIHRWKPHECMVCWCWISEMPNFMVILIPWPQVRLFIILFYETQQTRTLPHVSVGNGSASGCVNLHISSLLCFNVCCPSRFVIFAQQSNMSTVVLVPFTCLTSLLVSLQNASSVTLKLQKRNTKVHLDEPCHPIPSLQSINFILF